MFVFNESGFLLNLICGILGLAVFGYLTIVAIINPERGMWRKSTHISKNDINLLITRILGIICFAILSFSLIRTYYPIFQDIPALLAEEYCWVNGEVIAISDESAKPNEIIADIVVREQNSGNECHLSNLNVTNIEKGSSVKIAYLEKSQYVPYIEIDGKTKDVQNYWVKEFILLGIVLANCLIIGFIFKSLKKQSYSKKKKYWLLLYRKIYVVGLILLEMVCFLQGITMVLARLYGFNPKIETLWNVLLILFTLTLGFVYIFNIPRIIVKDNKLYYYNFFEKCISKLEKINQVILYKNAIEFFIDDNSFILQHTDYVNRKSFCAHLICDIKKIKAVEVVNLENDYRRDKDEKRKPINNNDIQRYTFWINVSTIKEFSSYPKIKTMFSKDKNFIVAVVVLCIGLLGLLLGTNLIISELLVHEKYIYMFACMYLLEALVLLFFAYTLFFRTRYTITREELDILENELKDVIADFGNISAYFTQQSLIIFNAFHIYRLPYRIIKDIVLEDVGLTKGLKIYIDDGNSITIDAVKRDEDIKKMKEIISESK